MVSYKDQTVGHVPDELAMKLVPLLDALKGKWTLGGG